MLQIFVVCCFIIAWFAASLLLVVLRMCASSFQNRLKFVQPLTFFLVLRPVRDETVIPAAFGMKQLFQPQSSILRIKRQNREATRNKLKMNKVKKEKKDGEGKADSEDAKAGTPQTPSPKRRLHGKTPSPSRSTPDEKTVAPVEKVEALDASYALIVRRHIAATNIWPMSDEDVD